MDEGPLHCFFLLYNFFQIYFLVVELVTKSDGLCFCLGNLLLEPFPLLAKEADLLVPVLDFPFEEVFVVEELQYIFESKFRKSFGVLP